MNGHGNADALEVEGEAEADVDAEGDNEDDNDDNEDDDDEPDLEGSQDSFGGSNTQRTRMNATSQSSLPGNKSSQGSSTAAAAASSGPTSHPNPAASHPNGHLVRPEALTAPVYDIVPTIAAPHSTSINTITATPDLRWVFSGGADGYIRKFNWVETANGKSMLTVAQKHPFVDSVTKAGVLMSYWENEDSQRRSLIVDTCSDDANTIVAKPSLGNDGPAISSVYSLAVHSEGLWLLSGLESGGINLQSTRHDEGKLIHCLRKHTSAVSVLELSQDERSVLSGSWDKTVLDWDLETGKVKRSFEGSGGQISALETRPLSSLPVPEASGEIAVTNGTLTSDNASKPRSNGTSHNNPDANSKDDPLSNGLEDDAASPTDSLFGGGDADSLFGDNDGGDAGASSTNHFAVDDEDDEFSRAIANGIQEQENEDADGDTVMADAAAKAEDTSVPSSLSAQPAALPNNIVGEENKAEAELSSGLPQSEDSYKSPGTRTATIPEPPQIPFSGSTFLAASIDGTLRVWDRRQSTPVARILPRNTPPWCMNACWSPDGNFIYAGRRNGTVDEFSLYKGLKGAERTFKLPNGSGPVSAVRVMPNGRHLTW